jgi:hypothetical protein
MPLYSCTLAKTAHCGKHPNYTLMKISKSVSIMNSWVITKNYFFVIHENRDGTEHSWATQLWIYGDYIDLD